MYRIVKALLKDQTGTSALEMGLICALIVIAMLSALDAFASGSVSMWNSVSSKSSSAMQGANS